MKIFLTLLFLLFTSCTYQSDVNPKLQRIMTLENSRCAPDSLYPFLQEEHPTLVLRAVHALGQLRDTTGTDKLIGLLDDARIPVVEEAAFSLGQIGFFNESRALQDHIESSLLSTAAKNSNTLVQRAIVEALGRTGSLGSAEYLGKLLGHERADLRADACMAVARLSTRKFSADSLSEKIIKLLGDTEPAVRWSAVYATTRVRYPKFVPAVIPLLTDATERIRMDAAKALGTQGLSREDALSRQVIDGLSELTFNDRDWRVRVNALNSLSTFKFAMDDLKKIYFKAAFDENKDKIMHVRIAAIRAMPLSYTNDAGNLAAFLPEFTEHHLVSASDNEKWEIVLALSQMFGDRLLDYPPMKSAIEQMLSSDNRYVRARTIDALALMKTTRTIDYFSTATVDSFQLVRLNAAAALGEFETPRSRDILKKLISEATDATVLAVAAQSAAKIATSKDALAKDVVDGFSHLPEPIDVEAHVTVLDVLGDLNSREAVPFLRQSLKHADPVVATSASKNLEKITGEKVIVERSYDEKPVDFEFFLKIKSKKPTAKLYTSKGLIEWEFATDDAPMTVMNFIRLSEEKYYNGNAIHRVVPNFVVQDGDPAGSGWGGPGYSIRAEFSQLHYERGRVGMASAGPDTEGSQWFVTHTPTPHLDRRYTIFANVITGMDVVDDLQVGDVVERIEIIWN